VTRKEEEKVKVEREWRKYGKDKEKIRREKVDELRKGIWNSGFGI